MSQDFEAAVDWVGKVSAPYVSNGQIDLAELDPMEPIWRLMLGIYWLPDADAGRASRTGGRWVCHELAARTLLDNAEKSRAAHTLLCEICADYINRDEPLLPSIRRFSVLHLLGRLSKPRNRRAYNTVFTNIFVYTLARQASQDFGLTLTRNAEPREEPGEAKPQISACDAVFKGLARSGHTRSFQSVKEICVGTTHKKAREMSNRWVEAAREARRAGIIPPEVLDRTWYGV